MAFLSKMRRSTGLLLLASAVAAVGLTHRSVARGEPPHLQPREALIGQWVWTARDRQLFEAAQRTRPTLAAAVFVGSLQCKEHKFGFARGLSPLSAGEAPRALVVRWDDSVTACLDRLGDAEGARALDAQLSQLLDEVGQTGVRFGELQLDYDAPVSKLPRYASELKYLGAHALRDVTVWITSIPVHVEAGGYGDLMRGVVAGHILQLFDTGLQCDALRAARLHDALVARALPFRLGYGAFERRDAPAAHACWLGLTKHWQHEKGAAGSWIFPAGIAYDPTLAELEGAP
jgi:hypothetical protein